MKLKAAQVIGLNTDQKAAQVLHSEGDGENAFFGLINLESDDAFTRGRQTLSEISDAYFDFEFSPSQKLSEAFKLIVEKLQDAANFDLVLSSVSGKALYLIGRGEVEVYLKRDAKVSQLLSVGAPADLISGFLQKGDRIFFATKNLTTHLSGDIPKIMDLSTDSFEEEISNRVSSGGFEKDGLSGLLLEISQDNEKKENEIIPLLDQEEKAEYSKGGVLEKLVKVYQFIPKTNKGKLILGIVLILIIVTGVSFQFKAARDRTKSEQFDQALAQARNDFDAAKGLSSLNPKESKSKLDSAINNLNKALSLKAENTQALDLKNQISQQASSILQQFSVSEFPLFLDPGLIKKGFSADKMSLSVGEILLLDSNTETLIAINLSKKSNRILAGESQLGKAEYASINGEMAFVYSYDKGIIRVDSNKEIATVAKTDEDWGKITDITAFASNIYLLDTTKGQIWKYLPTTDGYSDKREYLTKATKADLANAIRVQIESSVYVLLKDGQLLRFTRGEKDNFSYDGLPSGVKDPKSFFVSSDSDNLYLLDSGNSRVLILTKIGGYKGQINGSKFATSTDLVVDEKGKKVYLLEGSKIYTVDLK